MSLSGSCPKCKTSAYNNRQFVLMVNECGHSLCTNCVENLFVKNTHPCPTCGKTLRKQTFWQQTFEDPQLEKEVHIRKTLQKVYSLKEDDFASLREYNDYLEQVETDVYNLVNEVNLRETRDRVDKFSREKRQLIERSRNRKSKDEEWIEAMLTDEKLYKQRLAGYQQESSVDQVEARFAAAAEARLLIEELKESDAPAELIVDEKRKRRIEAELEEKERRKRLRLNAAAIPLAADIGHKGSRMVRAALVTSVAYSYQAPVLVFNGPNPPDVNSLQAGGYLAHVREATKSQLAGGFEATLACHRALTEAIVDLFVF